MAERLAGGNRGRCVAGEHVGDGRRARHVDRASSARSAVRTSIRWSARWRAYRRQIDATNGGVSTRWRRSSGCCAGAMLANAMFELPLVQASTHIRTGFAQWLSEFVATAGLVFVAFVRRRSRRRPGACRCGSARPTGSRRRLRSPIPAITSVDALSDTFAGIRPVDAPGFIGAQIAGAIVGLVLLRMFRRARGRSRE